MKYRTTALLLIALTVCGSAAYAQDKKFEFTPYVGYTASEGVRINDQDVGGGTIVNTISPKSGASWGLSFDFLATENFAIGFNWNQQFSKLNGNVKDSGNREFADMSVYNYHGIFTYNFFDEDDPVRPFLFGGLGATQYSPGDVGGQSIGGSTKFSTSWGGGVKFFASPNVGFRVSARWTPTYIKSDPAGIWCSPYWPWNCWVVGDADYSHQGEFSAGLILRF